MATAYHRDQPGAPGLSYSADVSSVAQFSALKALLKACLVTGYGSVPAAGWELANEGARFIVLRNGVHTGYVCLTWFSGGVVRVYVAETYNGMSGDVMSGDGLKTGTASANAMPQAFSAYMLAYDSAATAWSMVADEQTFIVNLISNNTDIDPALVGAWRGLTLYVGNDSSGHFIAVGGKHTQSVSFSSGGNDYFHGTSLTSLRDPATGLLVDQGSLSVEIPALPKNISTNQLTASILIPPTVQLVKVSWFGNGVFAGHLRGCCVSPEVMFRSRVSIAARSLGYVGTMTLRTAGTPLDFGDGFSYFIRLSTPNEVPFFLVTDNPEFW